MIIEPEFNDKTKQRHGCVSAYLYFLIILNSITSIVYILASDIVLANTAQKYSKIGIIILGLFAAVNLASSILILRWKKLGFWIFLASALVVFIININNGVGYFAIVGLLGIVVLYAILQFERDEVSAWNNLE